MFWWYQQVTHTSFTDLKFLTITSLKVYSKLSNIFGDCLFSHFTSSIARDMTGVMLPMSAEELHMYLFANYMCDTQHPLKVLSLSNYFKHLFTKQVLVFFSNIIQTLAPHAPSTETPWFATTTLKMPAKGQE